MFRLSPNVQALVFGYAKTASSRAPLAVANFFRREATSINYFSVRQYVRKNMSFPLLSNLIHGVCVRIVVYTYLLNNLLYFNYEF